MAIGDLSTLASAKAWLSIDPADTGNDAIIGALITSSSRFMCNYMDRGPILGYHTVTEVQTGNGRNNLILHEWPVISVSALAINGTPYAIQTNPPFGSGFSWDAWEGSDSQGHQRIYCTGNIFTKYPRNILISYTAGYQVQNEICVLNGSYTSAPSRLWYSDQGVTYNGSPLTYIANGTPITGQYTINQSTGVYTFAAADAAHTLLRTYSYTPEDLAQVTNDVVAWHFRDRDRIGMISKSLAGQETTRFAKTALGPSSIAMLQNFMSVVPL
jgi:hypothetical protein